MIYQSIKYFSGLNALRFFAAFLVVLHHAEQVKLKDDLSVQNRYLKFISK